MAWSTLFGHISLDLFGHMHRGVLDYDAHFDHASSSSRSTSGSPDPLRMSPVLAMIDP